MKREVLLTITGTQKYDDNDDNIELTTVGTIEELENHYLIKYKEEPEPPMRAISVSVKVAKDNNSVEVIRSGDVSSCLIVEKSKRNLCNYGTMYGDVLMGIYGKKIEFSIDNNLGNLELEYDIDINGALSSINTLSMKIQNN